MFDYLLNAAVAGCHYRHLASHGLYQDSTERLGFERTMDHDIRCGVDLHIVLVKLQEAQPISKTGTGGLMPQLLGVLLVFIEYAAGDPEMDIRSLPGNPRGHFDKYFM